MSRAILYGFAGAGVVVSIMAVIYSQSRELFLSPVFLVSLYIPYIILMTLALLKRPPYTTDAAIRASVVVFLIINAGFYIYFYLLHEVIDPELYNLQSELFIKNATENGGGRPGDVSQRPEVLYAPETFELTFGSVMLKYVSGSIIGVAISYLLGTLLGKKDQEGSSGESSIARNA